MTQDHSHHLQLAVASIFDEVQDSSSSHKRNLRKLYALHAAAIGVPNKTKPGGTHTAATELSWTVFEGTLLGMIARVLPARVGELAVERVIKFVTAYLKQLSGPNADVSGAASISLFTERFAEWLCPGLAAKDKNVRHHSVELMCDILCIVCPGRENVNVGSRWKRFLLDRATDVEPTIRCAAIAGLLKVPYEDNDELISGTLRYACVDPVVDVRLAAFTHLPLCPATLGTVLTHMRDVSPAVRHLIFGTILSDRLSDPQRLSIAQRQAVVRQGLDDEDKTVTGAVSSMLLSWLDSCEPQERAELGGGNAKKRQVFTMKGLLSFVQLFDLAGSGSDIPHDALQRLFETFPTVLHGIIFDDHYFKFLSPPSITLSRAFITHCVTWPCKNRADQAGVPCFSAILTHLSDNIETLWALLDAEVAKEDDDDMHKWVDAQVFVVLELLKTAMVMNLSDKMRCSKIIGIIRDMLGRVNLPESLVDPSLEILRLVCGSEKEFVRVLVEVLIDIRDDGLGEIHQWADASAEDLTQLTERRERSMQRQTQLYEMTPEDQLRMEYADIRCLKICIALLERVNNAFDKHSTLEGVLKELIIPSTESMTNALRELGILALSHCSLLSERIAKSVLPLLVGLVDAVDHAVHIHILRAICDLLLRYRRDSLDLSDHAMVTIKRSYLAVIESPRSDLAQEVATTALVKLVLSGLVDDIGVLASMLLLVVSPTLQHNLALHACLRMFFKMFCDANTANRAKLYGIFFLAFDRVAVCCPPAWDARSELLSDIASFFIGLAPEAESTRNDSTDGHPEINLAIKIVRSLYNPERDAIQRDVLCGMLQQLRLPAKPDDRSLLMLSTLVIHLAMSDEQHDWTSFVKAFGRTYNQQLRLIQEEDHFEDVVFVKLFKFIRVVRPLREISIEPATAQRRRSESSATQIADPLGRNTLEWSTILSKGISHRPLIAGISSKSASKRTSHGRPRGRGKENKPANVKQGPKTSSKRLHSPECSLVTKATKRTRIRSGQQMFDDGDSESQFLRRRKGTGFSV